MKHTAAKPEPKTLKPPSPTPVRFSKDEEKQLRKLKEKTGLNLSELIRRAVRFATPKFMSGEINVATLDVRTEDRRAA
jgi:hypothetical protein